MPSKERRKSWPKFNHTQRKGIMDKPRRIALVYRKMRINEQGSDFAYWQSRPPLERLEALEQIREEYHLWKYGHEPRLQRVLAIVKRS